ncbi:MAG TPA: AraC family transcriptional regulator [Kofleriaceae bacterium]|jgi:AraC family transcriptional regulator
MGSLAVRVLPSQFGGIQIHHIDLGDAPLEEPDPALAMCASDEDLVAIIPAKTMCTSECTANMERPFGVIIETRALHQIAARAGVEVPTIDARHKDGLPDRVLHDLLLRLQLELETDRLATNLYVDALLAQLIVHVLRAFSEAAPQLEPIPETPPVLPNDARLDRALAYIQSHLHDAIAVDDLAREVDLSPFHFSRAFKRWTGQSPHRYVLHARLEKAHRLVVESSLPFASIATTVGFYDQSHFGLHFKRAYGATPQQMRTSRKNVRSR